MLIFRVEDVSGIGPYTPGWEVPLKSKKVCGCSLLVKAHKDPYTHPVFSLWHLKNPTLKDRLKDPPHEDKDNLIYGLQSLKELVTWFKGFYVILHRGGFHVSVYEVPPAFYEIDVTAPETAPQQVVFLRNEADFEGSFSILEANDINRMRYYEQITKRNRIRKCA